MAGWVAVLPAALRMLPVARVARLVEPSRSTSRAHDRDPERLVALSQRVTALLSRHPEKRCLVRSLVLYRFLLRAGFAPELQVGFERTGTGLRGHAWVRVDGVIVTDTQAQLAALTPAMTFAAVAPRGR
jgi:hypothetical protein